MDISRENVSVRIFTGFLFNICQNKGTFNSKVGGSFFLQNSFPAILRLKKDTTAIKL